MSGQDASEAPFVMAWTTHDPGLLVGRGHPAGDLLELLRAGALAVHRPLGDA